MSGPSLQRYFAVLTVGLLLACALASWLGSAGDAVPEFHLGGIASIIAIKSRSTGKYLEVSLTDGLLRATADSPTSPNARFRVMVLGATTIRALRAAKETRSSFTSRKDSLTKSGCHCNGFSNEHGFGRYCHPWETEWQQPWCYVDDSCASATRGSFGRSHESCAFPYRDEQGNDLNYTASEWSRPYNSSEAAPPWAAEEYVEPKWSAPPGCPCSGYQSALGFGASCKAWEYAGQTPWCYVHDNCSLASATGNSGSFGHRYLDCAMEARQLLPSDAQQPTVDAARMAGRRLATSTRRSVSATAKGTLASTPWPKKEPALRAPADESELLEKVERLHLQSVALISVGSEGFVSVEMPPHKYALHAHARTDALSLRGVFSFHPSGALLAFGTKALLNLCDGPAGADAGADAFSEPAGTGAKEATLSHVCTGYREVESATGPHRKLLRTPIETSLFTVEKLLAERVPSDQV